MLQRSPSFWSKGDIRRNSMGSMVAYNMLLTVLCPTQMMNWTLEKSLKDDEELGTTCWWRT